MSDERELVAYLERWGRSLSRLQRAYPARWHVKGLSDEETRDALLLALLERVVAPSAAAAGDARGFPDQDDVLRLLRRQLSELRRRFRLGATPVVFGCAGAEEAVLSRHEPDHEERYVELEDDALRRAAAVAAGAVLRGPQRRWLSAFEQTARSGEFFASSDEPNLSAASRLLGRHRSSAQRAYRELQASFQRELRRAGS